MSYKTIKKSSVKNIDITNDREHIIDQLNNTKNEKEFTLEESYDLNMTKLKDIC